jgi:hypothetical protein
MNRMKKIAQDTDAIEEEKREAAANKAIDDAAAIEAAEASQPSDGAE